MAFEAAFMKLAHSEPRATVKITDAVNAARRLASPSDPQLQQYLEHLSAMRDEPLTASVPKISGSLGELTRLMESY